MQFHSFTSCPNPPRHACHLYVNRNRSSLQVKFGIIAPFFLVDSFTNCTGYRNAELAVMLGKLYSPEEALKIGAVDELADSKEAAMAT